MEATHTLLEVIKHHSYPLLTLTKVDITHSKENKLNNKLYYEIKVIYSGYKKWNVIRKFEDFERMHIVLYRNLLNIPLLPPKRIVQGFFKMNLQ